MKVLVGIMKSGENEFNQCVAKLKQQTHRDFDFFVVENLPNKEAHDELYGRFMRSAKECDLFLKLDADMVFTGDKVLESMCAAMSGGNVAQLIAWVNDVPSSLKIPGIQMYRSDTAWLGSDDQLNVDYSPRVTGGVRALVDVNWIDHMPNPNRKQLLRYGVHKALKAIQPNTASKNAKKALLHISVLNGIARNYRGGKQDYVLALIGGMLVLTDNLKSIDYNSRSNRSVYDEILGSKPLLKQLTEDAAEFWAYEVDSMYKWFDAFQGAVWTQG